MLNKNYSNNNDINSSSEIIHDEYLDSEITTNEVYNVLNFLKMENLQVWMIFKLNYITILLH